MSMATLAELAHLHTRLGGGAVEHLERLVASWSMLADLCFADLLLFAPVANGDDARFVVLGQVRPTTAQTLHREDLVGRVIDEVERPLVARAFRLGEIVEGEIAVSARGERARSQCIPVRHGPEPVGVLTRESLSLVGRSPGDLEREYVETFGRLARMIEDGTFPFAVDAPHEDAPRVGDGVLVLDATARVNYASPNAVSALHRIGVHTNSEGMRLDEVGFDIAAVDSAFARAEPVTEEVEPRPEVTVLVRCIPLLDDARPTGALVLLRDVTDLRRRDRLLLSKDATIREVHHRVKNNLQTISSLLRLQSRRLRSSEGRKALAESEQRARSIALVHEVLSREPGEQVGFGEIVDLLVRMAEEVVLGPRPVCFAVRGEAGELAAQVATPLSVVLNELLQNAVEHAFAGGEGPPGPDPCEDRVDVVLDNDGVRLAVEVTDNGRGLPPGFEIERTTSLGLSIARDLVRSQLGGTIAMRSAGGAGTRVELRVPLRLPGA